MPYDESLINPNKEQYKWDMATVDFMNDWFNQKDLKMKIKVS
jgi:hypothetical protein